MQRLDVGDSGQQGISESDCRMLSFFDAVASGSYAELSYASKMYLLGRRNKK